MMNEAIESIIEDGLETLQDEANKTAEKSGFHTPDNTVERQLLLMQGEIGKATEALRDGNPESKKIPSHSRLGEKLADLVIRASDCAQDQGIKLSTAVTAKMTYNEHRPDKHGRLY